MNKIQIIINSVLAAAIVALFVVFFTVNPHAKRVNKDEVVVDTELLPSCCRLLLLTPIRFSNTTPSPFKQPRN